MNRTALAAGLCAAWLCSAAAAPTASAPASAATSTPAALPQNPVPRPRETDPKVERVLTAMNNASTWGHPDLFGEYAGMELYSNGDYKAAIKYFKYGARYADKLSQLSIGLMYDDGQGVAKDPVTACAWLALAAERKYPAFIATRNRVCEALTPAQHDQAVAVLGTLMPEYGDAVAKPRMAHALAMARMQTTGSRLGFDSGIQTVGVRPDCGGPTIEGDPIAGCGSSNFWAAWRWDPKKYFTVRDAQWSGTVTVGAIDQVGKARAASKASPTAGAQAAPASASSSGH